MTSVQITPTDNGPYPVDGPVTVIDAVRAEYGVSAGTTIYLRRRGHFATKPFRDGTHETADFQAAHRAAHSSKLATPAAPA